VQAERLGQADHRLDDGRVVAALGQTTDKSAVDFQDVNGEALQVGQRRVARAEVVDRQLDPQTLERVQLDDGRFGLLHDHAFGDLELEVTRVEARVVDRLFDITHQSMILQLPRGNVDADKHILGAGIAQLPLTHLLTGFFEHPLANRDDQARVLGQRNEVAGWDQALVRVFPAHERLQACNAAVVQGKDRLVVHAQLAALDGAMQLAFQVQVLDWQVVHARLKERVASAASGLGSIQGDIRLT